MNVTFNVLDEPWIPVVTAEGKEEMLGIRQTLCRAHELREISSVSPLEEYAMYRFLGLFLMDGLRPESESDIEDLLENGRFDPEVIEGYITLCEREGVSFNLFDTKRPFLQSPQNAEFDREKKPVSVLDCTRPSGNNHTHFQHLPGDKKCAKADEAIRLLLTAYLFATVGAQGYPSGVYGAPPYFGIIVGNNLFETLSAELLPTDFIGIPLDSPPVLWRRTEPIHPKCEVGATSWLQGMLFPCRRIRLIPDESGEVSEVFLSQGENYVNKESWRDPYVTYRRNDTSVFPMRPSSERAVWRNFCDIVDVRGGGASQLLALYLSTHNGDTAELTLYGVETNKASYLAIYRHSLRLPLRIAKNGNGNELLKRGISVSEDLAKELSKSLASVKELNGSITAEAVQQFYRECERAFWGLCEAIGVHGPESELLCEFCDEVSSDAQRIFTAAVSEAHLRAHALAAAAIGRNALLRSIGKLKKEVRL